MKRKPDLERDVRARVHVGKNATKHITIKVSGTGFRAGEEVLVELKGWGTGRDFATGRNLVRRDR